MDRLPPTVHALLDHLERIGFTGSPRAVSADGEDIVTYIPGESVNPHAWSDEGIFRVGCLLRDLHDATADFVPPPDAAWHPWPETGIAVARIRRRLRRCRMSVAAGTVRACRISLAPAAVRRSSRCCASHAAWPA